MKRDKFIGIMLLISLVVVIFSVIADESQLYELGTFFAIVGMLGTMTFGTWGSILLIKRGK